MGPFPTAPRPPDFIHQQPSHPQDGGQAQLSPQQHWVPQQQRPAPDPDAEEELPLQVHPWAWQEEWLV